MSIPLLSIPPSLPPSELSPQISKNMCVSQGTHCDPDIAVAHGTIDARVVPQDTRVHTASSPIPSLTTACTVIGGRICLLLWVCGIHRYRVHGRARCYNQCDIRCIFVVIKLLLWRIQRHF
jgi:hypothetical protein